MVCIVSKNTKKVKYIVIGHAPVPLKHCVFLINPFILWTTFNTFMLNGNNRSYTLTKPSS